MPGQFVYHSTYRYFRSINYRVYENCELFYTRGSIFRSEKDILWKWYFSPSRDTLFFAFLPGPLCLNSSLFCIYFTLLLPLFSFSFPFLPFSFPVLPFFFYIFPLFSLPLFIFFPPNHIGLIFPPLGGSGRYFPIYRPLFYPKELAFNKSLNNKTFFIKKVELVRCGSGSGWSTAVPINHFYLWAPPRMSSFLLHLQASCPRVFLFENWALERVCAADSL